MLTLMPGPVFALPGLSLAMALMVVYARHRVASFDDRRYLFDK